MKEKILITGSNGFVGSFLTSRFMGRGYEVRGMDANDPKSPTPYAFIRGDVRNPGDVKKAFEGVNAIVHLAAAHHDFGIDEKDFFDVNVTGTQNILDAADAYGVKKIIFYSSVAVYGNYEEEATEESAPDPVNPYGKSKLEAEGRVRSWAVKDTERSACIIRPAVVFGPGNYANMYKLIGTIYRKRFIFVGKGDNVKSIAYVENLADATVFLYEKLKSGVDVYNYVDLPQMSIRQTVETIAKHLSLGIPRLTLPLGPVIAAAGIFDVLAKITRYNFPITAFRIKKFNTSTRFGADKIRAAGFRQRFELSEGFHKMVEWYLSKIRR